MHHIRDFSRFAESESALCTEHVKLLCYELPQNFRDNYHSYESPRLCTILKGAKEVKINNSEAFTYQSDGFILLPPHSNVHMFMPEHTEALVYEFDSGLIEQVGQKVGEHLQFPVDQAFHYKSFSHHQQTERTRILTQRIQDIFIENDRNKGFLVDLVCQELVYELLKINGSHDIIHTPNNHPIHTALKLINAHPEAITSLQEIAREVNMSPSNFSLQFKTITNLTPSEYLTQIKLKKAKQCLHTLSVTETAYELGYQNISHFIKLFKAQHGMTPKQFQIQNHIHL